MFVAVIALSFALSSVEPATTPVTAIALENSAPPEPEQVLRLPDALREQFHTQVLSSPGNGRQRAESLVKFLFLAHGLAMQYQQDATLTVAQAYQTRTANCLTFTLLTIALAREAGLQAFGQQTDKSLTWHRDETTIFRTSHVNAGIRDGARRLTIDVAWDRVMLGEPPEAISDARLIALYYNNRAVETMSNGQLELAQKYAALSLQLDPKNAASWSNAGVVHFRAGQPTLAEQGYLRALALNPKHPVALVNLGNYYHRIGAPERATPFVKKLALVQARDPLHQYVLALDFETRGDLPKAVEHFRRAIRLYRGEYRFHAGLARVYTQLGDLRRAKRELARAVALRSAVEGSRALE